MATLSRRSFFGGLLAATSVAALGLPKAYTPQRHLLNVGGEGQPFASIAEAIRRANRILSAEPRDHVTIMLAPGSYEVAAPIHVPAGATMGGSTRWTAGCA